MTPPAALSAQDYLAAIYEMQEEGIAPVQAEVARWMGVSAASVSEAVKRLRRDGLVSTGPRELRFTPRGRRAAERVVRRHRLAERFLIEVIGLPWHRAHHEAGPWERAISDEVEQRLAAILGDPATCPHGNPIPGSGRHVDLSGLLALQSCPAGTRATVARLTEDLELDLEVMRYFENNGLMPGGEVSVVDTAPDGTKTLEVRSRRVGLGPELADNVWVRVHPVAAIRPRA